MTEEVYYEYRPSFLSYDHIDLVVESRYTVEFALKAIADTVRVIESESGHPLPEQEKARLYIDYLNDLIRRIDAREREASGTAEGGSLIGGSIDKSQDIFSTYYNMHNR